jgi:hypothetical protein
MDFPPDIKSKIPKLSPQELEFFTEAKKIPIKFENLFSSAGVPTTDVYNKVMKSKETDINAVKLQTNFMAISNKMYKVQMQGEAFFNPKIPNNFISSMKIANMANEIDIKMGTTTNESDNSKKTFGEFAKLKMMMECVTKASNSYAGDISANMSTIFPSANDSMSAGTICDYYFALDNQLDAVTGALDSFAIMRGQIEEFSSLSSLKSMFNNPISNALLSGDISKGIPAIATEPMLKLLKLPPKFS